MRRSKVLGAIIAVLFVVLSGAYAIRTAVVSAYIESNPAFAASVWPGHPDVLASKSMAEVGQAAARGEAVPVETLGRLKLLSARSPLVPEPFLVTGATALRTGNYSKAEELLVAARQRSSRSIAARYLLSDLYLRQNRIPPALEELAVLTRLMPSISAPLAPALAQYAQTPGAAPRLRQVLKDDPQLESLLLTELAADPRNADLILWLARPHRPSDDVPRWQQRLVTSFVEAGDYSRAFQLWRRYAPQADSSGDISRFERSASVSPFTWTLAQGSAGSAETHNGGLQVVFTGRNTVTLASRVSLLSPGSYRMRMQISDELPDAETISWSITCLANDSQILNIPFSRARSGVLSARFHVPRECRAQKFELKGVAQTFPQTAEFLLKEFQVEPVSGQ